MENLWYTEKRYTELKKDAEVELAKFVTEVQNGLVIDGKALRFSEFVEIWKRDYGSKELAPSTYKRYCRMLETRLLPYFGHFYINKIKTNRHYEILWFTWKRYSVS